MAPEARTVRAVAAEKLEALCAQARVLPRAARLAWEAAGTPLAAWLALLCAQGLVPAVVVWLSRPFVDGLARAAGAGDDWARLAPVAEAALFIGLALVAGEALQSLAAWLRTELAGRVEDRVSELIQRQSLQVDLAFYESSDFHDRLHRARDEARYRPAALLDNAGLIAQNGVTLLAVAGVLAAYGPWLAAALVASTLPALVVVVRFAILQYHYRQDTTADERRAHYYDWLMTSADSAAEVRLFGLGKRFRLLFADLRARLRGERRRLASRQSRAELAAATVGLLIAGACVGWIAWRAVHGQSSLGDVALFYLAFSQGQRLMRTLLAGVGPFQHSGIRSLEFT